MKTIFTYLLVAVSLIATQSAATAITVAAPTHATEQTVIPGLTVEQILSTPTRSLDDVAGRRLTAKERRTARRIKRVAKFAPDRPGANNGMAIAALATGVGGLVLLFTPLGLIGLLSCITGIVLGSIALKRVKRGQGEGRGMALAGMICGIVGAALFVLAVAFIASLIAVA